MQTVLHIKLYLKCLSNFIFYQGLKPTLQNIIKNSSYHFTYRIHVIIFQLVILVCQNLSAISMHWEVLLIFYLAFHICMMKLYQWRVCDPGTYSLCIIYCIVNKHKHRNIVIFCSINWKKHQWNNLIFVNYQKNYLWEHLRQRKLMKTRTKMYLTLWGLIHLIACWPGASKTASHASGFLLNHTFWVLKNVIFWKWSKWTILDISSPALSCAVSCFVCNKAWTFVQI